ncbi:MAG: gliding motility-associated C-terminal domain-containing protein [Mangrovibacterium sp.]
MRKIILTLIAACSLSIAQAQITAPTASGEAETQYSSSLQDAIFIFNSTKGESIGSLTATSSDESATFNWSKLDENTLLFNSYSSESATSSSTLSGLSNGLYRVEIIGETNTENYQAWVMNAWYEVSAAIDSCDCEFTQLLSSFTSSELKYSNPSDGSSLSLNPIVSANWEAYGSTFSRALNPIVSNPPAENTIYSLTISDNYGCKASDDVLYESIVPEANFSANPMKGEAPLNVTFTNNSKNADKYEWSFYRSLKDLEKEFAKYGEVSDSIRSTSFSATPTYVYEESGSYMVKLLVSKTTDDLTCYDEMKLDEYIVADTSYIEAPNFFTPNGDGNNDTFLIRYTSMKSVKISIFNRWGKLVFETSNSNVGIYSEYGTSFAWDGKIGGKLASPGVYYYVVEGKGRDDKKHAEQGFFHLFREK